MVKPKREPNNGPKTPTQSDQGNSGTEHGLVNQNLLENSTKFLALNDDCILKIFEFLPLNDVCSLSRTCKRMHALGSSHFMRKYKSKEMVFVDWLPKRLFGDDLVTFPRREEEKYIGCFAKSMRSVTLLKHFSTIAAMKKLNNLYYGEQKQVKEGESEPTSPIRAIRFLDWKVDVSLGLCTPIKGILKNVESLTFEDTSINADLNGCLFPLMPKLKRLTILSVAQTDPRRKNATVNPIWQQPPSPSLEYFAWHKEIPDYSGWTPQPPKEEFPTTEIVRFLKMNPSIKFVSLRLDSIEQLEQLMAAGFRVDELFFTVPRVKFDARGVLKVLKVFCDKQQSMKMVNDDQPIRLHLQFYGDDFKKNLNQLELLAPYIVGMYVKGYLPENYASVLPKLIHVKVVQMNEIVPAELLCTLPNLEELFIACLAYSLSYYDREIFILGSKLPKLKKMYLNGYLHRCLRNVLNYGDVVMDKTEDFTIFKKIDTKRKKLADAQKLKVYLEVDQKFNGKKVDYDTVQILRSQTEAITNPFFNHTHLVDAVAAPDFENGECVIQ